MRRFIVTYNVREVGSYTTLVSQNIDTAMDDVTEMFSLGDCTVYNMDEALKEADNLPFEFGQLTEREISDLKEVNTRLVVADEGSFIISDVTGLR